MNNTLDRYFEIKKKLIELAENSSNIKAIIAAGSSTRTYAKADEYSDLDIFIVTEDTDSWLYGNLPDKLGNVKISFVEPTLGGGKERRILYSGYLDVDILVFSQEQFINAVNSGEAGWIMNRGYSVMFDRIEISELLKKKIIKEISRPDISENEFLNLINDFYFHTVWSAKKLLRGELWSAKMCIDSYLKLRLLTIIELNSSIKKQTDVWHDGRFLDSWADENIRNELKKCFAHYDKNDMKDALKFTHRLFARLAKETAEIKKYNYPEDAENFSREFLESKM